MSEEKNYQNVFFFPMGEKIEKNTIDIDVDGKREEFFLDKENKKILENNLEVDEFAELDYSNISFWGTSENSKALWDKMKSDDLIFFSKSNGEFIYMAKIWFKVGKEEGGQIISEEFWNNSESDWCFVYFLKDMRKISITKKMMNRLIGYEEQHFFQGLFKISDERVHEFWEQFPIYYFLHQSEFKGLGD